MVFDSTRERVMLFGGDSQHAFRGDTWAWDGTAWTCVATGGPSPRVDHALAYDATRRRVVLFGGVGDRMFGDTWEFGCPDRSPSDWDRSGSVNAADLAAFLSEWSAGDADFNGDGVTDTRDVADYQREWTASR
jgi:hypothetical protein